MNCKNCGSPLTEGEKFCKKCGSSTVEVKPVHPNIDPSVLVMRPMTEPTNELAKLAKPEDKKTIIVRKTSPLLIIFVFLLALALGYFGHQYLNKKDNLLVSINGYSFEIPTGLKINYQDDTLYLNNDKMNLNINIIDGNYKKIEPKTIDNYKYDGEKEYENNKYHLFSLDNKKIIVISIDEGKLALITITDDNNEDNINQAIKIVLSSKKIEEKDNIENSKLILDMKSMINIDEDNTGDVSTDYYEDTYVDISLEEIYE